MSRILALLLSTLLLASACLQVLSADTSLFEANLEHYDKDLIKMLKKATIHNYRAPNLDLLREKIIQKKDLKIKIFGDSHIAADVFSSELRGIIFHPTAIGFIYPLFPSYHRNILTELESKHFEIYNSFRHTYEDYPMGGVVARAKNTNAFIHLDTKLKQKEFIVRFVFKSPSTLATFEVLDSKHKKIHLSSKAPQTWTLSKEYHLTLPIKIQSLLRNATLGGYFIYNKENNNIIDHMGINGARSTLWLKWNQEIFDQELQALQYDLVIFSYGSNDAMNDKFDRESFLHNYKVLIRKMRKHNPTTTILLIAPPTVVMKNDKNQYAIAPNFAATKKAIRELAEEENLLLFDLDDFMDKTGEKEGWIEKKLSKKDVHLTPLGYRLTANAVYKALLDLLKIKE